MSFEFNSQISKSKYEIKITTDNYEQFIFIQEMARECVDGKHKEKKGDIETFSEHYGCTPAFIISIPDCCKNCPNHTSNGGSGICACALPYLTYSGTTYTR